MKILVCVKQVPDTSGKVAVNPDGTLNRASMQTIINPDDMNACSALVVVFIACSEQNSLAMAASLV